MHVSRRVTKPYPASFTTKVTARMPGVDLGEEEASTGGLMGTDGVMHQDGFAPALLPGHANDDEVFEVSLVLHDRSAL